MHNMYSGSYVTAVAYEQKKRQLELPSYAH